MEGSRANARTEGIRRVSTDWFMFVDSDVLLCKDWFKKAQADLVRGVGVVWGLNVDLLPNLTNTHVLKFQSLIARQCFKLRGGMHDILIFIKAVRGIRISEQLQAYEDTYIVRWVEDHGYKAVIGRDVYCLHYKPPENWHLQNGIAKPSWNLDAVLFAHIFLSTCFSTPYSSSTGACNFR